MINRSVVAGFGGQGVMMIGKMLCYASLDHGKHALFLPSYGTEQRGGTANCTVILSDEEIGSPMTAHIDTLIAMNEPSLKKFQGMVKPGGTVYINSSLVKPEDLPTSWVPRRWRISSCCRPMRPVRACLRRKR